MTTWISDGKTVTRKLQTLTSGRVVRDLGGLWAIECSGRILRRFLTRKAARAALKTLKGH